MDHDPHLLFTPLHVGDLELRNRVVMAPMTRNRAGPGDAPVALNARYYAQRASAGLIITEGSPVSPQGVGYPHTPGIYTDAQVAGWRLVTEAVHARGGLVFLQLWHVGRISHPCHQPGGGLPVAPSAVRPRGEALTLEGPRPFVTPRPLETPELPGIVAQFRAAARRAREAGFDGVELHGANGYLLDQFLRDGTNRRTDRYGGSVENRARLLLEVTEAVAGVWGAGRVGVRLSPMSDSNDMRDADPVRTFSYAAERLGELGLAYLHVIEPAAEPLVTRRIRERFSGPLMLNRGYDRDSAAAALSEGLGDLVSFARLFLANPDLPERFAEGSPLNEPDRSTFYGGDERGYTDYPTRGAAARASAASA